MKTRKFLIFAALLPLLLLLAGCGEKQAFKPIGQPDERGGGTSAGRPGAWL